METARNLGIALNAPTAEARCVVTDASGMVIYVGEITYPGDCVRLNIELIGQGRVIRLSCVDCPMPPLVAGRFSPRHALMPSEASSKPFASPRELQSGTVFWNRPNPLL